MIYQFAVVGAGPAGIAAVGQLLDHGISAEEILWIDPEFAVGDFGTLWRNVPSNTSVKKFLQFLYSCDSFLYSECKENYSLNTQPLEGTCELNLMADPLLWISNHLKTKVESYFDFVQHLSYQDETWHITLKSSLELHTHNVILAIGSEPKTLAYNHPVIPLQDAMDPLRIKKHTDANDCIAVFGSSHSAILVLKNLQSVPVKKIINFYRSPLLYAIYQNDHILFDNIGLKGTTAEWARTHLEGDLPHNLERVFADSQNIECYLSQCNKAIYAVGFERRTKPFIHNVNSQHYDHQGRIAPGLFGLGIAYPEETINHIGQVEYRVGLWKFMDYLQKVMPSWIESSVLKGRALTSS